MTFASPAYLFLLLLLIPVIGWYIYELRKADASLQLSDTQTLGKQPKSARIYLLHVPFVLRVACITLLSIALARPQLTNRWSSESTEGIDIMMALDISGTMQAEDLKPNRLEAAKQVASDFVIARPNDQIGLVVFAGESFTLLPMTTDKSSLLNAVSSVEMGLLEDGTAIGDGLATSINRIVEGKAKSKSIILLTDGSNNTGLIAPLTAAEIAKDKGIKVYTIGIGSNGSALSPVGINYYGKLEYDYVKVTIDEQTLQSIARMTGGKYYRATDKNSLEGIFKEIDALEKTKLDISRYHNTEDDYMLWAWLLLAFVGLDIVLRTTVMRNIP